jgi:hypothetical protein
MGGAPAAKRMNFRRIRYIFSSGGVLAGTRTLKVTAASSADGLAIVIPLEVGDELAQLKRIRRIKTSKLK